MESLRYHLTSPDLGDLPNNLSKLITNPGSEQITTSVFDLSAASNGNELAQLLNAVPIKLITTIDGTPPGII
jgi:hypothetical protein